MLSIGCSQNRRPGKVALPTVDSTATAAKLMELYDTNKDSQLSVAELAACPGMQTAKDRYDLDKNGSISADEVAAHLKALYGRGVGLMTARCTVTRGGQPLSGAKVQFIPEAALAEVLKPAEGTTNDSGIASMAIPDDQLPTDEHGLHCVQPGIYKVEVTHPKIKKTETKFGCEIDPTNSDSKDVQIHL